MVTADQRQQSLGSEVKFLIEASEGGRIRDWARQHLVADAYGGGPFGDEYRTASLYFDTDRAGCLPPAGAPSGAASIACAAMATRRTCFSSASFGFATPSTSGALAWPWPIWPDSRMATPTWSGAWFDRRLKLRRLVPTCLVSYHRTARQIDVDGTTVRLTVDDEVTGGPADR